MLFEKTFTLLVRFLTRKLSRYRAVTVLTIYAATAFFIILFSYFFTFSLILYPFAGRLFEASGRVAARHVPNLQNAPAGMATYMIGATSRDESAEFAAREEFVNYKSLPMRRPEVDLLLSYLRPEDTYLEYGASGTTLSFPMLVSQSYVIEHDAQVCKGISSEMKQHPELAKRLRAFCAPVPHGKAGWGLKSEFEEGSYTAFHNYVDFPRMNLSEVAFDKVLINGRARVACALRILPQLREHSRVFFHDYFLRPEHYSSVLTYYDEVARILAHGPVSGYTDEPMGLLVLKPKLEYIDNEIAHVTVARLNTIYDNYEETEPTEDSASADTAFQHGLLSTGEGGFPYYEMSRELARSTTRVRLLLDVIMIPCIVVTYLVLRCLFVNVFLEALSSALRSSKLFAGDIRAAVPWASRSSSATSKPQTRILPISMGSAGEATTSSTGKAE
ncbi:unnamed protein product [Chondrus crispus]|uniref:Methyltransferase n=1 Tax=Chondrus crispus TaxID=2769 RepID=R7Q9K2_CHOCR|nr:unnamed protein product [Chondrus crispus]CDF35217.1 unnamed protein product [Chondrus crispus]|eukprot:XP_005715036.1 unnamed protein product [Chondrus crispus]